MGKKKENEEIQNVVGAVLAAICKSEETAALETDLGGREKFIVSTYSNGYLDLRHEAKSKDITIESSEKLHQILKPMVEPEIQQQATPRRETDIWTTF